MVDFLFVDLLEIFGVGEGVVVMLLDVVVLEIWWMQ